VTDLTDRMRTCAAFIQARPHDAPMPTEHLLDDAAQLLIEAAHEIDVLTGPIDLGEPMEVIPPVVPRPSIDFGTAGATWTAPGDTLPKANPFRSDRTCPKCDSRAAKRVRMWQNTISLICPACDHAWPYTKKPPAEGTAGGKD